MKMNCRTHGVCALTRVEIVVIIAVVAVLATILLAGLILPALARAPGKQARIYCISNLKQIGLGLRIYSNNHEENFPWNAAPPKGSEFPCPAWSSKT